MWRMSLSWVWIVAEPLPPPPPPRKYLGGLLLSPEPPFSHLLNGLNNYLGEEEEEKEEIRLTLIKRFPSRSSF